MLRGGTPETGAGPQEPSSAHLCKGHIPVAFVFSAPGEEEQREGRPVAGDTGTNLESALVHLHSAQPALFPSRHRYDYRITNAWPEPLAIASGHRASEARDTEIREPRNVRRVLRELVGCNLVVLSGNKARLLAHPLRESGRTVVEVPHVGNKGLNGTFKTPARLRLASSFARREHRVQLWATAVLRALAGEGVS